MAHKAKSQTRKLSKSRVKSKLFAKSNNAEGGDQGNVDNANAYVANRIGEKDGIYSDEDCYEEQEDGDKSLITWFQMRPFYMVLNDKLSVTRKSVNLSFWERCTVNELGEQVPSCYRLQRSMVRDLLARTADTVERKKDTSALIHSLLGS